MWTACQDGESDHDCRNHVRTCEALSYAKAKDLDCETVLNLLRQEQPEVSS